VALVLTHLDCDVWCFVNRSLVGIRNSAQPNVSPTVPNIATVWPRQPIARPQARRSSSASNVFCPPPCPSGCPACCARRPRRRPRPGTRRCRDTNPHQINVLRVGLQVAARVV